ncbi:MAG: HAD family hydrolase [Bacteroidota bacterium]
MPPVIIFDRDGTLNVDHGYVGTVERFEWIAGVPEALARLCAAGFRIVVITNQSGVARGYYSEADVEALHAHMLADLARVGASIDAVYFSPYHPEGTVPAYSQAHPSRKPGAALFEQAMAEHGIDPAVSFAVGDRRRDLVPAKALGFTTVQVLTGAGASDPAGDAADHVVADVPSFADWVCAFSKGPK